MQPQVVALKRPSSRNATELSGTEVAIVNMSKVRRLQRSAARPSHKMAHSLIILQTVSSGADKTEANKRLLGDH
jgi:hypothetical protein